MGKDFMYFVPFDLLNIYRCKERKYTKGNPIAKNNTETKHASKLFLAAQKRKDVLQHRAFLVAVWISQTE